MEDMTLKRRSAGARGTWNGGPRSPERAHKAKLTWILVREIRAKFATGLYSKGALAREYQVDWCTIADIVTFRTWIPNSVEKEQTTPKYRVETREVWPERVMYEIVADALQDAVTVVSGDGIESTASMSDEPIDD
jgi:hypothetical protein